MWQYETTVVWKAAKEGKLHAGGKPEVCVAAPPDSGGPHNDWSPEQLLAGAVGAGLMTSALYYLERAGVDLRSYMSNATATIDKTGEEPAFMEVVVEISMAVADEADMKKARNAVLCAEKTCPISSCLQCPVRGHADVRSPAMR
jgi:organic hydroperoxide reductase OsmC/OhrA